MSVSTIMQNGLSGLMANQSALRTTSNNIANVNTEGYVRQDVHMEAVARGNGVQSTVRSAADRFLAAMHTQGISKAQSLDTTANYMDRAQATLGDPNSETSVFSGLDDIIAKAASLSGDPTSSLRQNEFVYSVQSTFNDIQSSFRTIDGLRDEADSLISSNVERVNDLLTNISSLNTDIQRQAVSGGDTVSLRTEQSQRLNDLAKIMDFKSEVTDFGGVELRTSTGNILVGTSASQLAVTDQTAGERFTGIVLVPSNSTTSFDITNQIQGGELRGLLNARDLELPKLTYALGELAGGLASTLNQAANEGTASPPPTSLTGRNTGLLATDSLNFTGSAHVAVVDTSGRTIEAATIDFDAGTVTNSSGSVTALGSTINGFTTALNSSLGASASVSFTDGALSLSATGTNGIAIAQDPTTPSDRGGLGVSAYFGLNDIVTSAVNANFDTGLQGTDAHGITSGSMTFGIRDENGSLLRTVDYTPTAGATLNDLVSDFNSTSVLGGYATATLDTNGRLSIIPDNPATTSAIDVIADDTQRSTTAQSLSGLFGLGIEGPAQRARSLTVNADMLSNPALVPTSTLDTTALSVGGLSVAPGENAGARALQSAFDTSVVYRNMGGQTMGNLNVSELAGEVASEAGSRAQFLETRADSARALSSEAEQRRAEVEGVNLDEEMVRMTVYQQSYAASSRLIQAARDMYDTLLNMV